MSDPLDDDSENALVKLTSLVVLGLGLTGLFLGYDWFWMVFVVGFAAVVPIVKVVTRALGIGEATPDREHKSDHRPQTQTADQSRNRTADTESKQDALDTLRSRYARGDLTEAEFEQKVELLLETETPESARKHVEKAGSSAPDSEANQIHGVQTSETQTSESQAHEPQTSDTQTPETETN